MELNQGTVEMEMRAMEKKLYRYNVAWLDNIPMEKEDSTIRILVHQRGGCASVESREIKISATEDLIQRYGINLCAFMELNFNWTEVNPSANLASWFCKEERKLR